MRSLLTPAVLVLGCAVQAADPAEIPVLLAPLPEAMPILFAATRVDQRGIALADARTRRVVDRVETGAVHDLVVDRLRREVLTVEMDEDDGGTIVARPVALGRFGPPRVVARLDGRALLLPLDGGLVVFESSYGDRWRLLNGTVSASVPWPRPRSAWSTGSVVEGLVRDDEGWSIVRADASGPKLVPGPRIPMQGGEDLHAARCSFGVATAFTERARLYVQVRGLRVEVASGVSRVVDMKSVGGHALAILSAPASLSLMDSSEIRRCTLGRTVESVEGRALADLGSGHLVVATDEGVVSVRTRRDCVVDGAFDGPKLAAPLDGPL